MKPVQWDMRQPEVSMAELHISWNDGRTEVRSLLPGQITSVGDTREPLCCEEIPLGGNLRLGRVYRPFCRVRLHGYDIPAMRLVTGDSTLLPSAIVQGRKYKRK
jgi:hypothetical protein